MESCSAKVLTRLRLSDRLLLHVVKIDDKRIVVAESGSRYDSDPVSTSIVQLFNYSDLIIGEMKKNLNVET